MKYFIINNASRAASYGIGTYVRQLTVALGGMPSLQICFIDLYGEGEEFVIAKDEDGLVHYKVPKASTRMEDERYCRMAYCLLSPYLPEDEPAIFHFNYFQHYPFAALIKARNIRHRVFLSVHYLNWCFELDGNVTKFKSIVNEKAVEDKYRPIIQNFVQNKRFLHLADEVIVLSRFCKDLLPSSYGISSDKLRLVPNGLQETATETPIAEDKRPLVLFVGRLDKIKGVDHLIEAFHLVLKLHENTRLVIVGDGDYDEYLKHCKGIIGKVIFTGKIAQEELLGFYRQATVGALPSFHEQCSYTAIEFMMHGIPFVGTDSTGLSEKAMAEALRHWERTFSSRKRQCLLLNPITLVIMKKLKSFSVKSMASLSREEMAYINGGSDDRYYTSCNMDNAGAKCIYDGRHGTCDYTITYSSSGKVLYYDTFCKV